jgi:hypothetical protein
VFESLFEDLSGDPDFNYAIIDGAIVRVRQHGIGAKGARKIRPLASGPKNAWPGHQDRRNVTRFGNLAGFVLPPGERYASAGVATWIEKIACDALRSDTAFDNDRRPPAPSSRRRPAVPAAIPIVIRPDPAFLVFPWWPRPPHPSPSRSIRTR